MGARGISKQPVWAACRYLHNKGFWAMKQGSRKIRGERVRPELGVWYWCLPCERVWQGRDAVRAFNWQMDFVTWECPKCSAGWLIDWWKLTNKEMVWVYEWPPIRGKLYPMYPLAAKRNGAML